MNSTIQKRAEEMTTAISGQMDAHLFESIISLFNAGVLTHYVRSPMINIDMDKLKMSVEAANGVRFEGREKIITLEQQLAKQAEIIEIYKNTLPQGCYCSSCDGDVCDYCDITESIKEIEAKYKRKGVSMGILYREICNGCGRWNGEGCATYNTIKIDVANYVLFSSGFRLRESEIELKICNECYSRMHDLSFSYQTGEEIQRLKKILDDKDKEKDALVRKIRELDADIKSLLSPLEAKYKGKE